MSDGSRGRFALAAPARIIRGFPDSTSNWPKTLSKAARVLAATAVQEPPEKNGRYALSTACIGVGQGIAVVLERV